MNILLIIFLNTIVFKIFLSSLVKHLFCSLLNAILYIKVSYFTFEHCCCFLLNPQWCNAILLLLVYTILRPTKL